MLYDFLLLEQYYEAPQTVRFYEELSEKYGVAAIRRALEAGHILKCRVALGPDSGRLAFWLSEEGRKKAQKEKAFA